MKSTKVEWLMYLSQLTVVFLYLFSDVNGKLLCGRYMRKKPKLPEHTRLSSKQRKNDYVSLACYKGYYFSRGRSNKDVSCKIFKSTTVDELPKCKGCGKPPGIQNGTVTLNLGKTSVGSIASYSCDVGFSLVGKRKKRKCRHNLRWSGGHSSITCSKNKCPDPGKVTLRNGDVRFSDTNFEEFTTISFECDKGYELFRSEEDVVCQGGQWSSKPRAFCIKKRCPLPDIPNGRRYGNRVHVGDTVEFHCNSGFTLYGSRKRTCQEDKTWNGTVAICDDGQSHCRNPGTPDGTKQIGRKYNMGDIVEYECKVGFKLFQGSRSRSCLKDGTWSGSPPRCVSENYIEFPPINETAKLFSESFVNGLLQSTCSGINVTCPILDARARALNLKYKGGLDLVFVLDTSSSIKKRNFEIAREFVKTIVEIFGVDSRPKGDGTHIACVTYGTRAKTEFTFNAASVQTLEKALKKIDEIHYTRGATATRLALETVLNTVLPSSERQDSKKALFLITDGNSNVGGSPKKVADDLKKRKVEIYVIGIGRKVQHESLRELASNKDNIFPIRSFEALKEVRNRIINKPKKDYSECGASSFIPHDARARVVGGVKTDERYWPWVVQILHKGDHICGGTLINLEYVLTAAHCFVSKYVKRERENIQVLFPMPNLSGKNPEKYKVHTILELHIHPEYKYQNFTNDIALVRIPKLERFTRNQRTICLPRKVDTSKIIRAGNNMYAIGWGGTEKRKPRMVVLGHGVSKYLKHVRLPFMSNKFCADNVKNKISAGKKNWAFNQTTQFCAGDLSGTNDTCRGDSGGPAMVLLQNPDTKKWRWFQIGMVSWGNGCAQKGEVSYYTKVSAFVQKWIDKTAGIISF